VFFIPSIRSNKTLGTAILKESSLRGRSTLDSKKSLAHTTSRAFSMLKQAPNDHLELLLLSPGGAPSLV